VNGLFLLQSSVPISRSIFLGRIRRQGQIQNLVVLFLIFYDVGLLYWSNFFRFSIDYRTIRAFGESESLSKEIQVPYFHCR